VLLLAAYLNKGGKFASLERRNEERGCISLCYTGGEARGLIFLRAAVNLPTLFFFLYTYIAVRRNIAN
jgi:hypothetical protein